LTTQFPGFPTGTSIKGGGIKPTLN
jgi:hypothetical protein